MSTSWSDTFLFAASVPTTTTTAFELPGRASTEDLILGWDVGGTMGSHR